MIVFAVTCALVLPIAAGAQVDKPADYRLPEESPAAGQARQRLADGQRLMAAESVDEAAKAFQEAIALDPLLMMAHYGLGTARMAKKEYAAAITAFEGARDAFQKRLAANAGANQRSEANRQERIQVLRERVRSAPEASGTSGGGAGAAARVEKQEYEAELAMLEAADQSGQKLSQPPPGLLLALGSAYFRNGRLADAEREYRATLEVQPKQAEARINLAVVLLMTGRPADAKEQLKQAKKAGYKVPAGLEADIETALAKAKG
jgi:tetratricopeptide (TPR) repeat protein